MTELGARRLTISDIVAFAEGGCEVRYSSAARERIARAHETLLALAAERPVYGLSTGVGARRVAAVERDRESCLRLWRSHSVRLGSRVDEARVRAMMVIRANQIAAGGAGVSPALAASLLAAVEDAGSFELTFGSSLGTGDLSALGSLAVQLVDRGAAFEASDGLPFMSSSALTLADAALTLHAARRSLRVSVTLAAAIGAIARATPEHYDPRGFSGRSSGMRETALHMRAAIGEAPERVQDPFSLRLIPQSLGAAHDALGRGEAVVEATVNRSNENPVVLHDPPAILHTGNFSTIELALAVETLTAALAHEANLLLARLSLLFDHRYTAAHDFLSDGASDSSGAMILEYTAGAALGEIRDAAAAHGAHGIHISHGAEEYAPFTPLAVRRLAASVDSYRTMLACVVVALGRIPRTREVLDGIPAALVALADRDLTDDLRAAAAALDTIQLRERGHPK